ncbi:MAG: hypothetical protein KKC18_13770 [Chloroflexi bacterium]|nr:hypothetical protein [Chloroflexota bacterium]
MNQTISLRAWTIIAGIGVAVVVGLALLLAFLARGPGELAPVINLATPPQSDDPVVASVNGHTISRSSWVEAVLLDQVLSGLAGQPAPTSEETLQRLINEELVLQAIPPEQEPTAEQVETHIATLEQDWGVYDSAVVTALERTGLERAMFERAVGRLLMVQAGLETLREQGYDTDAWLEEQRNDADIQIFENVAALPIPTTQSPVPTSPLPVPTVQSPIPAPTSAPPTDPPAPAPALALPKVAPDFTLERAGGGALTLTEQLAQGPVVLVFFQKCG